MKAILEFNLEDYSERREHKRAISATDAYLVLYELDSYLRDKLKYNAILDPAEESAFTEAREKLSEFLSERSINLSDLE
jgi:hypothetical protein